MVIILHHYLYLVEKAEESKTNLLSVFSLITCGKRGKPLGFNSLADDTVRNWQGYSYGGGSVDTELFSPSTSPLPFQLGVIIWREGYAVLGRHVYTNISSHIVPIRDSFLFSTFLEMADST